MIWFSALASGAVIGLSIAAPVGPMAILCINRTLNAGITAGVSTGAGASSVTTAYASVAILGLQQPFMVSYRPAMGLASAVLMLLFAWRILKRKPYAASRSDAGSTIWNFSSAVAFNCLNPTLIVLLLSAVGVIIGPEPPLGLSVSIILLGVFLGSFGWWILLSAVTCSLRERLSIRITQRINRVVAIGMLGLAALLIGRVVGG